MRGGRPGSRDLPARLVVVHRPVDAAEHTGDGVLKILVAQPRQRESVCGVIGAGIVHHDLRRGDLGVLCHLQPETASHHAVLAVDAEGDGLAVAHGDQPFLGALFAEHVERSIVEDRTVLHDLDQRRAGARRRRAAPLKGPCDQESSARPTNVASAPRATDTGLKG